MISSLAGWDREEQIGGITVLRAGQARIRYIERAGSVRPIDELVTSALANDSAFRATWIGEPEAIATDEGEHAALISVDGDVAGVPARYELAFVFGDDFVDAIVGRVASAPMFAQLRRAVRELAIGDALMLGKRPRRPAYDGPNDWNCIERGLRADWVNPSFPDDPAAICVWPALPDHPDAIPLDRHTRDARSQPVATRHELVGTRWTLEHATGLHREVIMVRRDGVTYVVRLDCRRRDAARHRAALNALVESLRPIPTARRRAVTSTWMSHWVD